MSANDMQIGKYELPVNRGAKSYELQLVIELYGMSSRVGGNRVWADAKKLLGGQLSGACTLLTGIKNK